MKWTSFRISGFQFFRIPSFLDWKALKTAGVKILMVMVALLLMK
jgi:hypothetical protein